MPAEGKINSRSMMKKAIEVMHQSVPEHRPDGSPSPSVGAVIVRPDGSIVTAARGELREGNHAEFILLERKCPGERLDRCTLFTTLEPCLDRNKPKCGCARHIVSARIKEVYVGLEDDNPRVAGKGIEHLRRHGVTVRMFDRDLQDEILSENQEFFAWARRQPERPKEEPIKLSKYEDPVTAVALEDLSQQALERYGSKAGLTPEVGSQEFLRILRQQGVLVGDGDVATPSGFGLLLFGKQPRNAMPQAGLLARADLPDGSSSRKEFGQALVLIPDLLERWLKTVLPSTIDRSHMERKEEVDLPFDMIRESVVNALIHRDYDLAGQKCQFVVNADTITVKSPGGPIPPVTLDELQSFTAPMKSRNPVLHYTFARMGMAEEQGFGLEKSLKGQAQRLNLPLPTFALAGDYLVLTIYRSRESAVSTLPSQIREQLSKSELAGWVWISKRNSVATSEYEEAMKIPNRTAKNHIQKLTKLGLLKMTGAGKATRYEVIRS
jgi:ATP-dependent DNA helicase RecG